MSRHHYSDAEERSLDAVLKEAFLPPARDPALAGTDSESANGRPEALGLPDRYRIDGLCGRGGMGVVYRARDTLLERDVAIKVLDPRHAHRPDVADRFRDEAQIASQLQHPHIVPVHDVGTTADDRPFFTMKLVQGRTLASLLAGRQHVEEDQPRYLGMLLRVCQAIAYAHARHVVHRDLKPGNVMSGEFGEVVVMDFGMSKLLGQPEPSRTCAPADTRAPDPVASLRSELPSTASVQGSVLGTYAYMPPEQAAGDVGAVSERSDVWCLGAILCEILTGTAPYHAATAAAVRAKALAADIGEARRRIGECAADPELKALCLECLEPDPAQRPRDASVVAERLGSFLASIERRAEEARLQAARAEERAHTERRTWRLQRLLLLVIAGALAAGLGAWLYLGAAARQRTANATAMIDEAIGEARQSLEKARQADDPAPWAEAASAARRAVALASQPAADAAARVRAAAALGEVEAAARAAEERRERVRRDDQMRQRLRQIAERHLLDFDHARADRDYETAFRAHGLDVDRAPPSELAAAVRASPLRDESMVAIHEWGAACASHGTDSGRRRRLMELAEEVDDDPVRRQVRELPSTPLVLPGLHRILDAADLGQQPAWGVAWLAGRCDKAGDRERARRIREAGLLRYPGDFWLNFFQAGSFDQPGQESERVSFLRAAQAAWPESIAASTNLGGALANAGRLEEARAVFERALSLAPEGELQLSNLSKVLLLLGQSDAAQAAAQAALRLAPDRPGSHYSVGRSLRRQGRFAESEQVLAAAYARWPDDFGLLMAYGALLCDDLNRAAEAADLFERAAAIAPSQADPFHNLGNARKRLGQARAALRAFSRAVQLDPNHSGAHEQLGALYYAQGDYAKARTHWQRAADQQPGNAKMHWRLGEACAELGDRLAATAAFERAVRLQPDLAQAWLSLSQQLLARGHVLASLPAARKALQLVPSLEGAAIQLGVVELRLGRARDATLHLRLAIELDPSHRDAYRELGMALLEQGDVDGALAALGAFARLRAVDSLPRELALAHEMAALQRGVTDLDVDPRAVTTLLRAVALARLCDLTHRPASAARLWARAIELDPTRTEALGRLAHLRAAKAALAAATDAQQPEAEVTDLRRVAREQLEAMVDRCLAASDRPVEKPEDPMAAELVERLKELAADPRSAPLRAPDALAQLPASEAKAWQVVWRSIRLLAR